MANHMCKRLEFVNECPYAELSPDYNMSTYLGEIIERSPAYSCNSVPCHHAIEVILRLLVKSKE